MKITYPMKRQAANMKKRLCAGFTFAETLVTVALIGIVFVGISAGFVVFQRAYTNITRKANAQVMLSTAIMKVTDDLKNTTVFYSADNAIDTDARGYAIRYDSTDKSIGINVVPYSTDSNSELHSIPLLTSKTNTNNMYTALKWDDSNPCVVAKKDYTGLFTLTIEIYTSEDPENPIASQRIQVRSYGQITSIG